MGMLMGTGGKCKNKKVGQGYFMWLADVTCISGDLNIRVDTVSKCMIGDSLLKSMHSWPLMFPAGNLLCYLFTVNHLISLSVLSGLRFVW
jgi:hypothetical protein